MAFVLLNMQAESRCLSHHNYTFQHCPSRLGAASLAPLPPATASTARRLPHATGTGRRAGAGCGGTAALLRFASFAHKGPINASVHHYMHTARSAPAQKKSCIKRRESNVRTGLRQPWDAIAMRAHYTALRTRVRSCTTRSIHTLSAYKSRS